jgi:hypothetical protein
MMLAGEAFRLRNWKEFRLWAGRAVRTDWRSSKQLWTYPVRSMARLIDRHRTFPGIEELQTSLDSLYVSLDARQEKNLHHFDARPPAQS